MSAPISVSAAFFTGYAERLREVLRTSNWSGVAELAQALDECWHEKRQVFLCGNGGSAGNAMHLANDLLYGVSKSHGLGLRATALPANSSVLTCLANDVDYASIFSAQLAVLAQPDDVLIALSGSGNSPNIVKALERGKAMGMKTFAILGYTGGKAKSLADVPIHFAVDDMQLAEDLQLVVGHMLMQWLYLGVSGRAGTRSAREQADEPKASSGSR